MTETPAEHLREAADHVEAAREAIDRQDLRLDELHDDCKSVTLLAEHEEFDREEEGDDADP